MFEKRSAAAGATPDGLGQVIVFIGSRGGVGATTSAVSCAWLLSTERRERIALVDVALFRDRVVLAAASHIVVFCERSLAGLRDTIRLQTLMREQAPQARLWLVEAGATGERALIGKSEFEKGVGKALDTRLSYDPKSAGAAANSGQPLPVAAPRSPVVRELRQLTELLAGPVQAAPKRRVFALPSLW